MGFRVLGTGGCLPRRRVTNDELSQFLDTSDEWIRQRTGIVARHVCTTETLDDLATKAASEALRMAGVSPEDLDLVVCSTTSSDHLMPAEASAVSERLGARCPSFDVSAACAGFIFALDAADGWFARDRARYALVIGAERYSRILDWNDRATCVLFGDGAGAVVLGQADEGPLSLRLSTRPEVAALDVPGVTGNSPFYEGPQGPSVLSMKGREVFKFGVTSVVREIRALAKEAGMQPTDITHLVLHQANGRILDSATNALGLDPARVERTIQETGNISSACIPFALDRMVRQGRVHPGDTLAMVGFGAGLSVGSCLLRWDQLSAHVDDPQKPAAAPAD